MNTYFSSFLPDIVISTDQETAEVEVLIKDATHGVTIYDERLTPVNNTVAIRDVQAIVRPYAKQYREIKIEVGNTEYDSDGNVVGSGTSDTYYCLRCLTNIMREEGTVETWLSTHFLTLLDGEKTTAPGRTERLYICMTASDYDEYNTTHKTNPLTATITATFEYDCIQDYTATLQKVDAGANTALFLIDVSPNFTYTDDTEFPNVALLEYTVTYGQRTFTFHVDTDQPSVCPVIEFANSFGYAERIYFHGTLKTSPSFKYTSAYIDGKLTNYDIEETSSWKADTGVISAGEANWCRELARTEEATLYVDYNGKGEGFDTLPVTVTDAKIEYTNDDDELPRCTFTLQPSGSVQNVSGWLP